MTITWKPAMIKLSHVLVGNGHGAGDHPSTRA